jgi:hypothetical protein
MYAHSLENHPRSTWEPLDAHLATAGRMAAVMGANFGFPAAAEAAGLLHDIGKASLAFQSYIAQPRDSGQARRGPDHSTAGAREGGPAQHLPPANGRRSGIWQIGAAGRHFTCPDLALRSPTLQGPGGERQGQG